MFYDIILVSGEVLKNVFVPKYMTLRYFLQDKGYKVLTYKKVR